MEKRINDYEKDANLYQYYTAFGKYLAKSPLEKPLLHLTGTYYAGQYNIKPEKSLVEEKN